MYYDLNVAYSASATVRSDLVSTAVRLGYDGVAYNHHLPYGKVTAKDANAMQLVSMPTPSLVPPYATALRVRSLDVSAARHNAPFIQLTRVTLTADDVGTVNALAASAAVVNSYDLVAVHPTTEAAFHAACQCDVVDVIVIDCAARLPFLLKRPAIHLARARGIHFELSYAPSLRDPSSRRYFFSTAMALMRLTKGKHVILTSAAQRSNELRSAYDVANLARVIHMQNSRMTAVISTHCHTLISHAHTRKHVDSAVTAVQTQRIPPQHNTNAETAEANPLLRPRTNDETQTHQREKPKPNTQTHKTATEQTESLQT